MAAVLPSPRNRDGTMTAGTLRYALASSYAAGRAGTFAIGPFTRFDPSWMVEELVPFEIDEHGCVRLPVDLMIVSALLMSREIFERLVEAEEAMDRAAICGAEAVTADDDRRDLSAVLEVAPWVAHPDYGVIRRAQFEVENLMSPAM